MGQLPSVRDTVASDTTTSATYEDVVGLTVDLTVDDTSDILLLASIQAEGSTAALAGWRLVFDGTNFLDLERQVDAEDGNINLVDLVSLKGPGTYTFKLQHKVAAGTLTTKNATIIAVSLHNGDGAVPAESDYVASDTVGNSWSDITGLSVDITLSKTSHIWAMLVLNGYHSGANKDTDFAINIDATRMEVHDRDWQASGQYGCVSIITRTDSEKTSGVYTVKAEWKGSGGSTFTGEDIKLVVIAAEANSGAVGIHITKDIVVSDTTTATSLEDITGLSVLASPEETAHILALMTLSTDVTVVNTSAYTVIDINGTNSLEMERGHTSATRWGSVGQIERTTSTLASGDYTVKGEWYTDPGNTLTGGNIVLTSIVLAGTTAEDTGYEDRNLSLDVEFLGYEDRSLSLDVNYLDYEDRSLSLDVEQIGYLDRNLSLEIELTDYEDRSLSLDIDYLGYEDRSLSLDVELAAATGYEDRSLLLEIEQTDYEDRSLVVEVEFITFEDRSLSLDINYLDYEDRDLILEIEILTYEDRSLSLDINFLDYEDRSLTLEVELVGYLDRSLSLDINFLGYFDRSLLLDVEYLDYEDRSLSLNVDTLAETGYEDRDLSLDIEQTGYLDRDVSLDIELGDYEDRSLSLDINYRGYADSSMSLNIEQIGYSDRNLSLDVELTDYEDRSLTLEVELIDYEDRNLSLDINFLEYEDRNLILEVELITYEDRNLSLDINYLGYEDLSLSLEVELIDYEDRSLELSVNYQGYEDRSLSLDLILTDYEDRSLSLDVDVIFFEIDYEDRSLYLIVQRTKPKMTSTKESYKGTITKESYKGTITMEGQ